MTTGSSQRFGKTTEEEMMIKRQCYKHPSIKQKGREHTSRILEGIWDKLRHHVEFGKIRLNDFFGQLYINARKADGNHYKISSLENIRY